MRKYTNELKPNEEVEVAGWVHEKRIHGKLIFLVLRDREGFVQVTLSKKDVDEETFKIAKKISKESVIKVIGIVRNEPKAPNGIEIVPKKIIVLNKAQTPLPLDPTEKVPANLDTRLDNRFMDLRRPRISAIFKIRSKILNIVREFFHKRGFIEVHTPRIIATGSEGGTELFALDYFGREAFLSQSPQLYKQMLMASGLDKVFEIATYFRAEEHNTVWHLNEITAIDCEVAFIDSHEDVMKILEELVVTVINRLNETSKKELSILGIDEIYVKTPFPRISYDKALEILNDFGIKLKYGEDLTTEAEKKLYEYFKQEGYDIYFIKDYPYITRPFYTYFEGLEDKQPEEILEMLKENPKIKTRSFDLDYKGREISSGSQRIHIYNALVASLKFKGLRVESFKYYLEAFKYGMPPHGGFGLGIERFLMQLLDLKNIREAVLFPRDRNRLTP